LGKFSIFDNVTKVWGYSSGQYHLLSAGFDPKKKRKKGRQRKGREEKGNVIKLRARGGGAHL
jgi:hypothetical protein